MRLRFFFLTSNPIFDSISVLRLMLDKPPLTTHNSANLLTRQLTSVVRQKSDNLNQQITPILLATTSGPLDRNEIQNRNQKYKKNDGGCRRFLVYG